MGKMFSLRLTEDEVITICEQLLGGIEDVKPTERESRGRRELRLLVNLVRRTGDRYFLYVADAMVSPAGWRYVAEGLEAVDKLAEATRKLAEAQVRIKALTPKPKPRKTKPHPTRPAGGKAPTAGAALPVATRRNAGATAPATAPAHAAPAPAGFSVAGPSTILSEGRP